MSKSKNFGHGWFPVGFILGVGVTLVFAYWFGEPFYEIEAANHNAEPSKNYNQQGFGPIPPAFISTQDTLAQWVMAVFSIVATGFSVFAVLLVRSTLEASIDANEIMREEQRPWLVLDSELHGFLQSEDAHGMDDVLRVDWGIRYNVVNKGKSPAFKCTIHTKVLCLDNWFHAKNYLDDFLKEIEDTGKKRWVTMVFPGETSDFRTNPKFAFVTKESPASKYFAVFLGTTYTDSSGNLQGIDMRTYFQQQIGASVGPWTQEFRSDPDMRITK